MRHDQIVVLHSRQPMGEGLRRAVAECSVRPPIYLTDGQGPLFRDAVDLASLRIERREQSAWWDFVSASASGAGLVTNDEFCLETCQAFRQLFARAPEGALRGSARAPEGALRLAQPASTFPHEIRPYRDKALMQQRLQDGGLPVPRSITLEAGSISGPALRAAYEQLGSVKSILKPCDEANLRGIRLVESAAQAEALSSELKQDTVYLLEPYYPGRQFHANCLVFDGEVVPLLVGEYTAPLLHLAAAKPAGSITLEPNDPQAVAVMELARGAVRALGADGRFVVHAEFLSSSEGELVIGEVACRAPGGDVPWQAREHCGVDLEELNIKLQLGAGAARPTPQRAAAWVWFPGRKPPASVPAAGMFVPRFHGMAWLAHAPTASVLRQQLDQTLQTLANAGV